MDRTNLFLGVDPREIYGHGSHRGRGGGAPKDHASFRVIATIAMRRMRPFLSPTRARNHLESALSG
jgi:hypothetical protein